MLKMYSTLICSLIHDALSLSLSLFLCQTLLSFPLSVVTKMFTFQDFRRTSYQIRMLKLTEYTVYIPFSLMIVGDYFSQHCIVNRKHSISLLLVFFFYNVDLHQFSVLII